MNPGRTAVPREWSSSRRSVLSGLAGGAAVGLAGCLGGGSNGGGASELSTPVRGDPEADVRVMVFEDYACPHCRTYDLEVYPAVRSEYIEPGRIRYEYHDFPIPVDEQVSWQAASAARAVQAAADVTTFFEYRTRLFENQASLGPDTYEQLANEMDLDGESVRQAAVDETYRQTVNADREYGREIGVQGTPTVVVGQQAVPPTFDEITSAIDDELGNAA